MEYITVKEAANMWKISDCVERQELMVLRNLVEIGRFLEMQINQ